MFFRPLGITYSEWNSYITGLEEDILKLGRLAKTFEVSNMSYARKALRSRQATWALILGNSGKIYECGNDLDKPTAAKRRQVAEKNQEVVFYARFNSGYNVVISAD